ncbi:TPA: hypothetical protein ACQT19_003328 [Pseudomonas aeruginosa]|uniref:hypothetical protein n=2 Tax=Pseudomonas aeruginosa TaxID=287 RepID=UPI003D078197
MRPATPAVMGRNLAVPRGNRRRSQGNDSNDERPAGCRSPVGERGSNTDFTGWPSTEGQTGSQHALEGKTMTHAQAIQFKGMSWFVKITCPEAGHYVVHVESATVMDCTLTFENYEDLVTWSRIWE